MKLENLLVPALLLVASDIWARVAIQGIEQGLLSFAIDSTVKLRQEPRAKAINSKM